MSRYTAKLTYRNNEVIIAVGFDINDMYFFYVEKQEETIVDVYSNLEGIQQLAKDYGIVLPEINKTDFRLFKTFNPETGEINRNFTVMYLVSKYDHISDYLTVKGFSEKDAIANFNKLYPNYHIVAITE